MKASIALEATRTRAAGLDVSDFAGRENSIEIGSLLIGERNPFLRLRG